MAGPMCTSERRRRSLGGAKAPEAQAHTRFRTCLGHTVKPPYHYAGVLTRALRGPEALAIMLRFSWSIHVNTEPAGAFFGAYRSNHFPPGGSASRRRGL